MVCFRSSALSTIQALFHKHEIKPRYGLGQNFLVDERAIKKLIAAANIQPEDTVLEIGPGTGVLTKELAKQAKKVIAVEKDAKMVEILRETLVEFPTSEVTQGDALKLNCLKLGFKQYKVVANLPYYITAPTIRKFLEAETKPESLSLMIQKEVAQRICARPPDMSMLAVSVQFYAGAKTVSYIKKSSFWPQPKVDSAIIHIVPRKEKPPVEPVRFFEVVKAGFSHPRKQLLNNLSGGLDKEKEHVIAALKKNTVQPTQRAETLSIQDWINLANDL